jgi:tetratricopeptide (TPR) repeat protein
MNREHRSLGRRVLAAAAAAALLLLSAGGSLHAQDSGAEVEEPPKSVAASRDEASQSVAARLVAFGDWCVQRLYRRFAEEQFEAALRFDPDHPAARQRLGYRREGKDWVRSSKRPKHVDVTVKSPQAAAVMETELRRAYEEMAKTWADHARHCDWMGDDAAARAEWKRVLFFDPAHVEARREAGFAGSTLGWRLPVTSTPRVVRRRVEALVSRLKSKDWGLTSIVGGRTTRGNLAAGCEGRVPGVSAGGLLNTMEITRALLRELGLTPSNRAPDRFTFHSVSTAERYAELVAEFGRYVKTDRSEMLNFSGFWWLSDFYVKRSDNSLTTFDSLIHKGAEHFFQVGSDDLDVPPWLMEGLGYLASSLIEGTAITRCASLTGTGFRKELPESFAWDDIAREDIEAGLDPPLDEFFVSGLNDLSVSSMVKSRSFLLWLSEGDPGITIRLAKASVKGRLPRAEAERVFEAPLEAVDREWRLWARRP